MIGDLLRRLRARRPARLVDRLARQGDRDWGNFCAGTLAGQALLDRDGALVRLNEALRALLPPDAPTAAGVAAERLFAAEDRAAVRAAIADALDAPSRAPDGEALGEASPARLLTARLGGAGERLIVQVQVSALREDDGAGGGAILRVRDLSREARLEAQLEHSQRLQVAGRLAGEVAHDFNNLLTAIIGAAGAIADRAGAEPATREDVAAIRASAERGAALVRHLMAFGQRQPLAPRLLDVNAAILDLASVLRRVLPSSIRLELALEPPGAQVNIDPTALDQVLLNLSVNARDAMPGGGTLTLRSGRLPPGAAPTRDGAAATGGDYALVEVQDTGRGIPPEVLPHIFDPFFTTRRDVGGSGLGLSTVDAIVRQSGGFLAVDSAPGAGARIRVYLPIRPDAPGAGPGCGPPIATPPLAPATRAPDAATEPPPRGALLLVDDEDTVLRITARALRARGWRVLAASSAEAALELLASAPGAMPDVVVTDLAMPGMDGAALVRALRARPGGRRLPAILVSGYAAGQARSDAAGAPGLDAAPGPDDGATRFLAKPYDMHELASALDALAAIAAA